MACSGGGGAGAGAPTLADAIFHGGPILTVEPPLQVEALAIADGRILRVGALESVRELQGPSTEMVDLQGRTLMPGFVEPHLHLNVTANQNTSVWVGSYEVAKQPKVEVLAKLFAAVQQLQPGEWLYATGFDPSRCDPLFATLTLADLNALAPDNPVFVLNDSGHIGYVNQAAFDAAGITDDTPNPTGGEYVRDADGHLTGQVNEPPSYGAFFAKMPPPTLPDLTAAFAQAQTEFSNAGITTVGDMNTGLSYGLATEISILRSLASTAPVRVRAYPAFLALRPGQPLPVQPQEGDDKLRFLGIKFTTDGSTQGFTAALHEPYLGTADLGNLDFPSTPQLIDLARPFFQQGWQLSCHANGDRAIDQVLELYASLLAGGRPGADRRLRIEHFTVTSEAQVQAVRDLGLTPSMTIGHTYYWGQVFDQGILGPVQASRLDPAASLKARGVPFSFHSDCPVSPAYPLRYLENSVTRVPQSNPPDVLGPDQRITIDVALRAVTLDAAWQVFMDDQVGSLAPGKYADLLVLGQNPRAIDPSGLAEIPIHDVYLAGVRQGPPIPVPGRGTPEGEDIP